jgi:hypothetical protein
MVDAFESKWADRWKKRKGFSYNDLVELSIDQKNIERKQAEMLVNEKVFNDAYTLVKQDDKGRYSKEDFFKYYADFMTTGIPKTNTSTGIPFLEYQTVDLDNWMGNVKNEYRKQYEKESGTTFAQKGAKDIFSTTYNYGTETDSKAFIAGKMKDNPNLIYTIRKNMEQDGVLGKYSESDTPTLDYLIEKKGLGNFIEPRIKTEEKPTPESRLNEEEKMVTIPKSGDSWRFNDKPIKLTGYGDSQYTYVTELIRTQPKGKPEGLYFKVIKTLPDIGEQIDSTNDLAGILSTLSKQKYETEYVPYENISELVGKTYNFKDIDSYLNMKPKPVNLNRPKEGFQTPSTMNKTKKIEDLRSKYGY